jgi:mannitol-1-phosphate 5-dehydrogenase
MGYEIAVIGAGMTGRGFVGRLLTEAGAPFLLIDRDEDLVRTLNESGRYSVRFFGDARSAIDVGDCLAIHTESLEIQRMLESIKLVFVSVGGSNLAEAGAFLARVLKPRLDAGGPPCSAILCENAIRPALRIREAFLSALEGERKEAAESLVGFSEAAIFCTTVEAEAGSRNILSEDYSKLPCDARPLKPNVPPLPFLAPVEQFDNFLLRKLYTYNSASAAISYMGWLKGYSVYSDAANDGDILMLLDSIYKAVGEALCKAFGYDRSDQAEFASMSLKKFRDRAIADTIERNAREPQRKLAAGERIVGPARLVLEQGGDPEPFETVAAAALLYDEPGRSEWNGMKAELGPEGILKRVCVLRKDSALFTGIMRQYGILKTGYRK